MSSSFWRVRYGEARVMAFIMAAVLWTYAAVFFFATPGYRSIAGPLKGGDFIFFYTLGVAARAGDPTLLYNVDRLHALQTKLLPDSAPEGYLPVYPPQLYVLYLPLSFLSYGAAAVTWTLAIVIVYAWIVWSIWRTSRDVLPDGTFVALAAAAFPPFWSLVLHAHNSIIPLLAFFLAWRSLERRWHFVAGVSLGLLFLKPTFGLAVAAVVLLGCEWAILGGLAVAAAIQMAVVAMFFDISVLADYVRFMQVVAPVEYLIEPKPFELHSLRAITRLTPHWVNTLVWIAASAFVLERTLRVWRSAAPVAVRMGLLGLASVLVSPHLFVYDATVLVLPLLWISRWIQSDADAHAALADRWWTSVVGLYATFLLPFARVIFVQLSVVLMLWLHVVLANSIVAILRSRRALLRVNVR